MRKGKNGSCMHEVQCPAKYAVTVHAACPPACLPGIAMISPSQLRARPPLLVTLSVSPPDEDHTWQEVLDLH